MPLINEALKSAKPMATLKFDDGCNAAVRANNDDVCAAGADQPEAGGSIAKMRELQGGDQNPKGFEYSVYKYEGDSAEELVALLLYQDFDGIASEQVNEAGSAVALDDPNPARPPQDLKCGLLEPSAHIIGISNKPHTKCVNSI
mmetsp:Transcript_30677/g.37970  ORF Transcript_30677/g.37970 Transcript_30677/m.37970 type:complete len:144 (+) Transcript_30677:265-696(+)|eukprot:CAMPEP_0170463592 /NCGR_PEP_ID=MMETSP0123-20130129/8649_1 /TAXON_ID=182087 /ORGANISM="Favella ehrenbergii, Strain Fehren 1" /LENGTH=143 /DNA_ID=CAMNT_0010729069 /DNA_START=262 /DNA_END=693 /DNA_ORIENTATION=-